MRGAAVVVEPSVPSQSFTIKLLPVSEEESVVQIVRAEVSEQFGGFCGWKPGAVPGGAAGDAQTRLAAVKNHHSEGVVAFILPWPAPDTRSVIFLH